MLSCEADSRHLQELVAVTLFIRCMSHDQSTIILCKSGLVVEAKIVARSLMEAMFILVAISKDYGIAVEYVLEDEFQRIKAIRRYMEIHDAPPPGMTAQQVVEWEKEIRLGIKEKGIKKRTTEDWAKAAELEYWYKSPYFHLSEAVHVKSGDLTNHIVTDSKNEPVHFNWGPTDAGARIVLGTAINCLCIVVRHASAVFKIDVANEIDSYHAQLRGLSLEDKKEDASNMAL
jgi:hypothetical protein